MVSSNLLMQELNSKKGDMQNLDEALGDQTESESYKNYSRCQPIESEPAKQVIGDTNDS